MTHNRPEGDHVEQVPTDAIVRINVPDVHASSFQLMYAGNDLMLIASLLKPIIVSNSGTKEAATMLEPVAALHMSVSTAKDLTLMLQGFIDFYEKDHGELKTDFTNKFKLAAEPSGD